MGLLGIAAGIAAEVVYHKWFFRDRGEKMNESEKVPMWERVQEYPQIWFYGYPGHLMAELQKSGPNWRLIIHSGNSNIHSVWSGDKFNEAKKHAEEYHERK